MNEPPVHLPDAIRAAVADAELLDVRLLPAELPLTTPLQTASATMTRRDVIRVAVEADVGGHRRTGWGEAAPLPWWGLAKLKHVAFELGRLRDAVQAGRRPSGAAAVERMRLASARFAVSSAVLDAVARARARPVRRLFGASAPNRVALNAAVGLVGPEQATEAAGRAVAEGFGTLKVKVGDRLQDDLARIDAVRTEAPDVALRLDANGAWDEAEATERIARLADYRLEYVEQPVPADDVDALARVAARVSVPIAADEACLPLDRAHRLLEARAVGVLVLKPALLGGWSDIAEVVAKAEEVGVGVVFTSAVDSGIGRAIVAQFATLLPRPIACGLATGGWLHDDAGWEEIVDEGQLYLGSGNGIGFVPTL